LWNELNNGSSELIEKTQKRGKQSILIQHGRRGVSRIYPPFNEKLLSNKVCVWGKNDKERLIKYGVPEDKIFITGTPIFKHLKPRIKHDGINVVFCPEHWGEEVPENLMIVGQLRKLDNVNIITKLLNIEHNPHMYDNPVISDRQTPEHLTIVADLLSKADVVVAISESTFELMAEILDIPVIIADIWIPKSLMGDERYKEYKHEFSPACKIVKDIKKLNEEIMFAVKHPEKLREERKQIGIDDGGLDIENPVNEIIKVIENI